MPFETPIVLFVFNRYTQAQRVFEAVSLARPSTLLMIADGARDHIPGESDKCRRVLEIPKTVDWPCRLLTNYSATHLGCRERIISGLEWAFSLVEEAIILEDDCLPHPTFFTFCETLLARYRGDIRIAMISGTNFVESYLRTDYSYFFSRMVHTWGWATWRDSWRRYDPGLSRWPEIKKAGLLREAFEHAMAAQYWTRIFDRMYSGAGPDTWDYQWFYTSLVNNALSIVPAVNLVTNIGFGHEATHTSDISETQTMEAKALPLPLRHPPAMIPLRTMDYWDQEVAFLGPFRRALTRTFADTGSDGS